MKKNIGIIFADEMEYSPFLASAMEKGGVESRLYGNDSVSTEYTCGEHSLSITAVKCGIGKVNAASATMALIADKKADFILNAGLSGAVSRLRREDIIAATTHVECDYDLTAIGYGLGVKPDGQKHIYASDDRLLALALTLPGVGAAGTGTGDLFLTDKVKKQLYYDTFGVESFDMETAAIASVCDKCSVPLLCLRKISDDADDCSAEDYREMNERQEQCLTDLLFMLFEKIAESSELMK